MGLFDKIENATPTEGGVYLQPGVYPKVEVLAIKTGETRLKRPFFVAETKIHESSGTGQQNMPGSTASWMVMLDNENALGNIRDFVAQLFGVDLKEVDAKSVEALVSKEQPGAGRFISAEATIIQTKKGSPFTKVKWATHPMYKKAA